MSHGTEEGLPFAGDRLAFFISDGANLVPAPRGARLASPGSIRLNEGDSSTAAVVLDFGLFVRLVPVADFDQAVFRVPSVGARGVLNP